MASLLTSLTVKLNAFASFASVFPAASRVAMRTKAEGEDDALTANLSLSLGTAAGQCNAVFIDHRTTPAASGTEKLNISGGAAAGAVAMKDPHGQTIAFTKILGILIVNNNVNGGLKVGGEATYDLTTLLGANGDQVRIRAGGKLLIATGAADATGYVVATDEVLQIVNEDGANAADYTILIAGVI